jgi:succinoglycan biosynthesis protein ExoA
MTILAVIPCLNEEAHIERLVRTLARDRADKIVIADGGSTDRTPEIARKLVAQYPNVIYLHNPKRLQSAAVNLAVETHGADAEFLIRLDAHADYPADYCAILLDEQKTTGADSVVVSMNTMGKGRFQRAVAAAQNSKMGNGGAAHRNASSGKWVEHGHHALMRLEAFRAVGGYDKSFSHNEDAELDIRLRRAGYKIWLTGKTALTYYPRSAPWPLLRQYLNFGRGRARTILNHRVVPSLRQLAPAAIAPAVALALLVPFYFIAALPAVAWAVLCLGYGALLGVREKSADIALSGPAAMLMHLGWSLGFWTTMIKNIRGALK